MTNLDVLSCDFLEDEYESKSVQRAARTVTRGGWGLRWKHWLLGKIDVNVLIWQGYYYLNHALTICSAAINFYHTNIPVNLIPTSSSIHHIVDLVTAKVSFFPIILQVLNAVCTVYGSFLLVTHIMVWFLLLSPVLVCFSKIFAEMTP